VTNAGFGHLLFHEENSMLFEHLVTHQDRPSPACAGNAISSSVTGDEPSDTQLSLPLSDHPQGPDTCTTRPPHEQPAGNRPVDRVRSAAGTRLPRNQKPRNMNGERQFASEPRQLVLGLCLLVHTRECGIETIPQAESPPS
jgi:hypothetical protein